MQQYVCIAMPECAFVVGYLNASDPKCPTLDQLMKIDAGADAITHSWANILKNKSPAEAGLLPSLMSNYFLLSRSKATEKRRVLDSGLRVTPAPVGIR